MFLIPEVSLRCTLHVGCVTSVVRVRGPNVASIIGVCRTSCVACVQADHCRMVTCTWAKLCPLHGIPRKELLEWFHAWKPSTGGEAIPTRWQMHSQM